MKTTFLITSVAATHYTGELSQYEGESEEFPGLRGDGRGSIKSISIKSRENLAWQVEMQDADDNVIEKVAFSTSDATEQIIDSTTWYFYTTDCEDFCGWMIPLTIPKETVSIVLRNMSAAAKTAGTDGVAVIKMRICK